MIMITRTASCRCITSSAAARNIRPSCSTARENSSIPTTTAKFIKATSRGLRIPAGAISTAAQAFDATPGGGGRPLMRFGVAVLAGFGGLILGTAVSVGVIWFAGRLATSLFAIAAIFLAFPAVGFALGFEMVWL